MKELPNLEVAPKPRGKQFRKAGGVSVFGDPFPNPRVTGETMRGHSCSSPKMEMGDPEAVIKAETEH